MTEAEVWLSILRGGETRADGQKVPRKGAWVEGRVRYHLAGVARPGERLVLLNFAESMPTEPTQLVETALETYIDGPFDAGALQVTGFTGAVEVGRRGEHRDVVVELQPGVRVVELRYTVDVPKRYWPFGCVERRCSLSGAIAPLPSVPAEGGIYLPEGGRVVQPVKWTVHEAALAGDPTRRPGADADARPLRRPWEVVVVGGDGTSREYPSVFWGPRWHRVREVHRGVVIEMLHMRQRPSAQVPEERFVQLRRDLPGNTLQIATELVDLLAGVSLTLPPDSHITVVQGPLRSDVAEAHPDVVVVSDQALQIFPADRFTKFHLMAIARAQLDMLMQRQYRGTHDASTDLWLAGMVAFALAAVWRQQREHRDEFAGDILRNLTFVPAVDAFLYTQQAAFSQSYFRGVEDAPPIRNHPLWFSHALPTGRRLHEKLADTIGADALAELYARLAEDPRVDPRTAAEESWGYTLDWFFDQWLGPYPSVDYVLHEIDSEREGTGWVHRITVERVGEVPVIEPVQVFVEERDKTQHHLLWNGQLALDDETIADEPARGSHTWELHTGSRLKAVRLDPRARLLQVAQPPHDNVDPRFNDRRPPKFRFLYSGAGFSFAAAEFFTAKTVAARFNAISGFAGFTSSLRRDIRRSGGGEIFRNRNTVIGGSIYAQQAFGPKVHPQRRRAHVYVSTAGELLNPSNLDPRGGLRLIQSISLTDNTRRFSWWPDRGRSLSIGATTRQTLRVDGQGTDDRYDIIVGGGWTQLWPVAHDHVIATRLSTDLLVPLRGDPEFRGLLRAGGIGGLAGYTANEIFGRGLALAQIEYRHVYVRDLPINILHTSYMRALAGTLTAGVGSVSSCDSYRGWFGKDSYYASIGYALGAYLSVLGVTPQLTRVEVSVPLVRRTDVQCLGRVLPDYLAQVQGLPDAGPLLPPFSVNLVLGQNF